MVALKRPNGFCKDCWNEFWTSTDNYSGLWPVARNAPFQGPRCYTHHQAFKKARRDKAHERRVQQVYNLEPGEYEKLYEFQGGRCWICRRATGKTRRLSVDHDHRTGLVRGLLCRPCNDMLGHVRDDPSIFEWAALYLRSTPYSQMKEQE